MCVCVYKCPPYLNFSENLLIIKPLMFISELDSKGHRNDKKCSEIVVYKATY